MTVGYPDYARLSNAGGYLLYRTNGSPPENTVLFQGYVGLWPYINMFTSMNASNDYCRIQLSYFADESFSELTGFRYATRTGASFAITQYGNISPWLRVSYITISGNPISFQEWSIYGTTGYSPQINMTSADVPIFTFNQNVATTATFSVSPLHIQPGDASLMLYTTSAKWHAELTYFDFGAASPNQLFHLDDTLSAPGGIWDMPMLDAPHTFLITNDDTVTHQFVGAWTSK